MENILPDKPSDLILLALKSEQQVKRDPRYVMKMAHWHRPMTAGKNKGLCAVCLAGSVMVKILHAPINIDAEPDFYNSNTKNKLYALNNLREGDIHQFCTDLKIVVKVRATQKFPVHSNWTSQLRSLVMPSYSKSRDKWRRKLLSIATKFKSIGM